MNKQSKSSISRHGNRPLGTRTSVRLGLDRWLCGLGRANNITTALLLAVCIAVASAAEPAAAKADLVVFRDTTDTPSTQWGGAPLNVSPTFQRTGIALLDSYHLERQVTQLDFVFGRSDAGVANAGSLLNHKFMISQLDTNILATYDVVAHFNAIQNNQQYSHVIKSAIFNPASDIDTPDDITGNWHLFYETFNVEDAGFIIPKNSPGAFQVFGLGQAGTGTDLLWQFSTGNNYIDWIDSSLDPRLAVPNPDFPTPLPQYAFAARGVTAIPEPSSLFLLGLATAGLLLGSRRRNTFDDEQPINPSSIVVKGLN